MSEKLMIAAAPASEALAMLAEGGATEALGDEVLLPARYSWNNPVAIVTIRQIYGSR